MILKEKEKEIVWSVAKNQQLVNERGLSFEAIVLAMQSGHLIASYPHPRVPHQRIFEVEVNHYVVVVPYVENEEHIFLKTAFHSRKANKQVLKGKHSNE